MIQLSPSPMLKAQQTLVSFYRTRSTLIQERLKRTIASGKILKQKPRTCLSQKTVFVMQESWNTLHRKNSAPRQESQHAISRWTGSRVLQG